MKFLKYAIVALVAAKISEKYWLKMFSYTALATDLTVSSDDPGKLLEIMTSPQVSAMAKKLIKDDIDEFIGKHAK